MNYIFVYFFSYTCVSCNIDTYMSIGFCNNCWLELDILDKECGKRIILRDLAGKQKDNIDVFFYHTIMLNQFSRVLMHRFKYYDEYIIGKVFARFLCRYIALNDYDYIIPIPMLFSKQLFRIYNPPLEMSNFIVNYIQNIKIMDDLLYKSKYTLSQTELNFKQRQVNLKGSFLVNKGQRIFNKKIILIDDVYTTGVTLNECINVLSVYGPVCILCLTITRS